MDLGQIIYIVAIVAYFLYRSVSKKKAGEAEASEDSETDSPKKGLSFEDLLREIRDAQVPKLPEEVPKRRPMPIPVLPTARTQQNPTRNVPTMVPVEVEESRFYEGSFEGTNKNPYQALSNQDFASPEGIKFSSYEASAPNPNPYAILLKNPRTVREAIVVSEILRPKYF